MKINCPDCGNTLAAFRYNGVVVQKCNCGYLLNTATGEESRLKQEVQNVIASCPHCSGGNRVPANNNIIKVTCAHCGQKFVYNSSANVKMQVQPKQAAPAQPKPAPQPQPKPAVPVQPKPTVTAQPKSAPHPQEKTMPQVQPKPVPQPQEKPVPKPQVKPCRTLTINRATHAYKEWDIHGLKNVFMDKFPVRIVLDDVEQGPLPANETMELQVDSNEHTIRFNLHTAKYWIPPGNDSYLITYFHDSFRIGPVEDEFRDGLTEFILNIFRGQGIRDRILDSNNYGNKVYLDINTDGIRIYWRLANPKGLKQILTGEGEEKISYAQMGLTPLAKDRQPGGYWSFIEMWIQDSILQDEKADMMKKDGGYTFCTKHSLF